MSAAADARHAAVEGYVASVTNRAMRLWGMVDVDDIMGSWRELSVDAFAYVSIGQMAAAAGADQYIDAAMPAYALGSVQPRAFAGVASDGRNLLSLLQQPAIKTLTAIGAGHSPERALQIGNNSLVMISASMITDAARSAEHTAIAARPKISGYIRTLHPPSCARCALLAGAWYRWNQGFQRHPRCDCTHEPCEETNARPTQPKEYFDSLSSRMQDRYFGKVGAQKIRSGEVDLIKYVSDKTRVRKGGVSLATATSPVKGQPFTIVDQEAHAQMLATYQRAARAARDGDTGMAEQLRRDARNLAERAYAERSGGPRIMPEQLTDGASRAEAIAALTHYGYIN